MIQTGLQTNIRDQLSKGLSNAGDVICVVDNHSAGLKRLRIVTNQAAKVNGMTVEVRTIENCVYARRIDFAQPQTTPRMPGRPADVQDTDKAREIITTLNSFRPWPDDPDYDRKRLAIERAVSHEVNKL